MTDIVVGEPMQASCDNVHFIRARFNNDILCVPGQIGNARDGRIPASIEDEFHNAWKSVGVALATATMDFGNIFKFTSYRLGMQQHIGLDRDRNHRTRSTRHKDRDRDSGELAN